MASPLDAWADADHDTAAEIRAADDPVTLVRTLERLRAAEIGPETWRAKERYAATLTVANRKAPGPALLEQTVLRTGDSELTVCNGAYFAMERHPPRSCEEVPFLLGALGHDVPRVRAKAASRLRQCVALGCTLEGSLPEIGEAYQAERSAVTAADMTRLIASLIPGLGLEACLPLLRPAAGSADALVQETIAECLAPYADRPNAAAVIELVVENADDHTRMKAVRTLVERAGQASWARLIAHGDPKVRAAALQALNDTSLLVDHGLTPRVVQCLRDPYPPARAWAAYALLEARVEAQRDAALAEVGRASRSRDTDLRAIAAGALALTGACSEEVESILLALLDDADVRVRLIASQSARGTACRGERVLGRLQQLAAEPYAWVQAEMAFSWSRLSGGDASVLPHLFRLVEDPDPRVRRLAAMGIGETAPAGDETAMAAVRRALALGGGPDKAALERALRVLSGQEPASTDASSEPPDASAPARGGPAPVGR